MFEKLENRPEEENQKMEKAVDFTGKEIENWLEAENNPNVSKIKTRTITFLIGLFLAFGAMGATAQAQDWRRLATRGVESVLVNSERDQSNKYLKEFQQEEARINALEEELYEGFRKESDRLEKAKDMAGLKQLEKEYKIEKNNLDLTRQQNIEDYKKKMEKQRTRRQATDFLRDVIR